MTTQGLVMSDGKESVSQVQRGEDAELVVLPDTDEALMDFYLRTNLINPLLEMAIGGVDCTTHS